MRDRLKELKEIVPDEAPSLSTRNGTQWYDDDTECHCPGSDPAKRYSNLNQLGMDRTTLLTSSMPQDKLLHAIIKIRTQLRQPQREKDERKLAAFMAELQDKVGAIEQDVSTIKNNTRELTALHTRALMSASIPLKDKVEMEELDQKSRVACSRAIKTLKELERLDAPGGATLRRVHATQLARVRKDFTGAMERHEAQLQRYAKGLRRLVSQQVAIVKGGRCDSAEVDACVQDDRLQIFTDNYQAREQEAITMFQDATDRHNELLELEKSITGVRELFLHVAVLVQEQGDTMDSIEAHVLAAADEVTRGRKQLKGAQKKQKSARKKKVILAGVGTGLAIGLIATVALL